MATEMNDYFKFLSDAVARPGDFVPAPYYDLESDALFFYARDVPSYAKRLNSALTLYLAQEDNTLVGCKVKSVQRLLTHLDRLKRFGVSIVDHKIKLGILLQFALATPPEDPEMLAYEDQIDQYGDVEIDRRELRPA